MTRVWRRILVVVLVVAVAVVAAASFSLGALAAEEPVKLKVWIYPLWLIHSGPDKGMTNEDWMLEKIEEFQKKYPNVDVELELLSWEGGGQKLTTAVASGTMPDIMYSVPVRVYAPKGVLEPIDEYLTESERGQYYPNILKELVIDGKLYALPFCASSLVLSINAELFEERGVPLPKEPDRSWTMDEFLDAAKKLTFDRDGDGRTDVYALGLNGKPAYWAMSFAFAFGGRLFNEDGSRFTFNTPEGLEGLQFMHDLVFKYKVVAPGVPGYNIADVWDLFLQRRIAMVPSSSILTNYVAGMRKPLKLVFVQFPHVKGKDPVTMLTVAGWSVFKQKDPYKRKVAMEFIKYLTNPENSKAAALMKYSPANRLSGNPFENDPNLSVVALYARYAEVYIKANKPEMEEVVNNIWSAVYSRAMTPKQAIEYAEQRAKAILGYR